MAWPPVLTDLQDDLDELDPADEAALQRRLAAAVAFVQRVRRDAFLTDDTGALIEPVELTATGEEDTLVLGALMLAGHLFARRRSQDGILWMADTGTTRIPDHADPDIARLLRIGKQAKPRFG